MFKRPKKRLPRRKMEEGLNTEYVVSEWFLNEQLFSFDSPSDMISRSKEDLGYIEVDCDDDFNKRRASLNIEETSFKKYVNQIDRTKK